MYARFDTFQEIKSSAERQGIDVESWSADWILELKKGSLSHRLIGYRIDVNNSVASLIARDKVATYELLQSRGIESVPHILYRKGSESTVQDRDWGRIVMKPLKGSGGHEVRLCDNIEVAKKEIVASPVSEWAISPMIDIKQEVRLVMMDGELLLAYAKEPVILNRLKMFNLRLGAIPIGATVTAEMLMIAKSAATTLALRLAVVDIIQNEKDEWVVLEVNDSLTLERYASHGSEQSRSARITYDRLLQRIFTI